MSKSCKWGHDTPYDLHGNCTECNRLRSQKHHAARREELAAYGRKRHAEKYGVDPIYTEQRRASSRKGYQKRHGLPEPTRAAPVICECCGRAPGAKGTALDHDHNTGVFRGWLCGRCNTALGLLGDTLDAVDRARAYLIRAEFI